MGMSGMWEGELGGQKQLEKVRAGVATPSMVDMVLCAKCEVLGWRWIA